MPSNRARIDADLVQKTQYNVPPNKTAKIPPPKPWPLPNFEPLLIDDWHDHGSPNVPFGTDIHDPFKLFSLFFTDELMDKLVEWTNKHTELYPPDEEHARAWQPTCKQELYAYLGVLIHMGITIESSIEDYWKDLDTYGTEHIVKQYIGVVRFQQLDRHFRASPPWPKSDTTPKTTFTRIDELAEYIRLTCRKLYTPGTHLAVDETIQRFMGRAPEIVNIPSKPTLEGFKIWVLANEGYILDFIWHAKGNIKGPVDLDQSFIEEGFSKTQAVVLDLLLQNDAEINERLYLPNKHVVWLDNLFTSIKLLTKLRGLGIGAAGTVRTTKTQREEQGDLEGDIEVATKGEKKKKVPAEQISQTLVELKLTHSA